MTEELIIHDEDPANGYTWEGFFKTKAEVIHWIKMARRAKKMYPIWVSRRKLKGVNPGKFTYLIWWSKPKGGGKMVGLGYGNTGGK